MESVHHFFKEVAGNPLIRPAWFYDVRQEGESIPDVGTHLVDTVQWMCFPDQALDWRKDIKVLDARRWPTKLTPEQFKRSTGLDHFPDYFKQDIGPDGALDVYANGEVDYTLRGVHAEVTALWEFEGPPGDGRHPLRPRARHPLRPRHQAGRRAELPTRALRRRTLRSPPPPISSKPSRPPSPGSMPPGPASN